MSLAYLSFQQTEATQSVLSTVQDLLFAETSPNIYNAESS